jgi:hypothetical protein
MIANIKPPKEWSVTDWVAVLGMIGVTGTGAYYAGDASTQLRILKEIVLEERQDRRSASEVTQSQISDHEKRISKIENDFSHSHNWPLPNNPNP